MKVQAKLLRINLISKFESVFHTTMFDQAKIQLLVLTAKYFPSHQAF